MLLNKSGLFGVILIQLYWFSKESFAVLDHRVIRGRLNHLKRIEDTWCWRCDGRTHAAVAQIQFKACESASGVMRLSARQSCSVRYMLRSAQQWAMGRLLVSGEVSELRCKSSQNVACPGEGCCMCLWRSRLPNSGCFVTRLKLAKFTQLWFTRNW